MYINSYEDLKDFIFRKLGSEQHQVEISELNFTDIYNKNIKYMYDYANDAVNDKYILFTLNNERDLLLSDNIQAVIDIFTPNTFVDSNIAYPGYSPVYDFLKMSSMDTSAYLVYTTQISEIRSLFRKRLHYKFNTESKRLIINEDIQGTVLLNILDKEEIELLYDNRLFQMLLERDCWSQWTNNLMKYTGSTIGNGIIINTDFMKEKYTELDEKIKEAIEGEEFDFLAPVKIV